MVKVKALPSPSSFGANRRGIERLGAAIHDWLDMFVSGELGVPRRTLLHAMGMARIRLQAPAPDSSVHLDEAIRFAAGGDHYHAGQHYRAWFRELDLERKRRNAGRKGSASNKARSEDDKSEALRVAESLLRKNPRLSKSRLARLITPELNTARDEDKGVSPETVRSWLKTPVPPKKTG